ncbi:isochorismatase family protein [Rhodococcus sp. IEGM 1330]|uniref:isochorismatase family protein n=1 Tax=Rhodococcus sp. IEGM 1330 TaxID=3082225 RepID=UPI002953873E|nr:isochorismatase family protein [Rhodococcus sp. IEGM 1330]MDV8022668.1 isochorismatase family protein [Rhodococcus sp. IEGM 1330]
MANELVFKTSANIDSYSMPAESDIPASRVDWTASPSKSALLIHDMQNYFARFYDEESELLRTTIKNIARLRQTAASLDIPIVYTAQPGDMTTTERGLLKDIWGPGMSSNPEDRDIIAALKPGENDTVLTKWRYSAFYDAPLQTILRDRGRSQLVICGVFSHVGCLVTAVEAFSLGIQPIWPIDAMADFSREDHIMAAQYVSRNCGHVVSTDTVVRQLESSQYDA